MRAIDKLVLFCFFKQGQGNSLFRFIENKLSEKVSLLSGSGIFVI